MIYTQKSEPVGSNIQTVFNDSNKYICLIDIRQDKCLHSNKPYGEKIFIGKHVHG